jgi:CubicO group peptidase (beta-lactamase class C family)
LCFAVLLCVTLGTIGESIDARSVRRLDASRIGAVAIDAAVRREMRLAKVPGAGIAIFNDGRIVYEKAYGLRDTARALPMTPASILTAASLTKSAFAVMVMQLASERIVDLDTPVYRYLPKPLASYPRYRDLAGDPRANLITLRMLLSHTSGFPNLRRFTDDGKLSIAFTPGTRFAYSGEGIELAQMVVEIVTKRPLNQLMNRRIFGPLGMTRTSMVWEARFAGDAANGYDEQGASLGPERRTDADAAGSMQTTLHDYALFIQATLQGTDLSQSARAEMLSPQIAITSKHEFPSLASATTTVNRDIKLSYGLGWGLYRSTHGKAFFKEGHDDGWRHYVVCFDASGTALLIMTNSSNGESMYLDLLQTLIGDTFTPVEWEGFTSYK